MLALLFFHFINKKHRLGTQYNVHFLFFINLNDVFFMISYRMTERTRPRAATVDGLVTSVQVTVTQVGQMYHHSQSVETVDECIQHLEHAVQKLGRVQPLAQGIDSYQDLLNECQVSF